MDIVNDEYWLKYGKSSIEKSITSRNEAASKLEKMTLWFWGLYTASFTIGVSINIIEAPVWVLVMLASPIVSLIVTYWLCILAQLPVNAEFDPTIPFEIKEAFNAGLTVKNQRFTLARNSTLFSAILLSAALFSLAFVQKKSTHSFDVVYNTKESVITVSGLFPEGAIVTTEIDSLESISKSDSLESISKSVRFYHNIYRVQENGILNLNIPLNERPKKITVSTTWMENEKEKGFIQTLTK